MLPTRFFADRSFSLANVSSALMSFGMFGSIFLLAQFLQFVRFYSPLEAGAAILPWTLAPMFVAPVAGALSDRIGGGLLMGTGLALQALGLAWLGLVATTDVEYVSLVLPFVISGIGMGLFFAPVANVLLSSVRAEEEGQASGAGNAIRELGGVFGVAVLAAIFSRQGSFASPQAFVDGMAPAVLIGAAFVALGSVAAFAIPRRRAVVPTGMAAVPEGMAAGAAVGPGHREPTPVLISVDD
jgi:MFS family permease